MMILVGRRPFDVPVERPIIPIRANFIGLPSVATRIRASMAA
jgi:hypothetical protein